VAAAWRDRRLLLLVLWAVAALTGFGVGGLFHPHYYVGLLAPLCALGGLGAVELARIATWRPAVVAAAAALAIAAAAAWPAYTAGSPSARSWQSSHDSRILHDAAVARWLRLHTAPGDRVYALYADASLYFAADRRAAFRYLWYLGVQHIPGALGDLERVLAGPRPPRAIAVYQAPATIDKRGVVARILARRYRRVATVEGVPLYLLRER
jgi:4-amino-4-deoxy-L-arabinose transferase-like glycosyltransferase